PIMAQKIDQANALLIAEGDAPSAEQFDLQPLNHRAAIYGSRRVRVNQLVEMCVQQDSKHMGFSVKLGRVLLHPVYGTIVSIVVCYAFLYHLLGVFTAGNLVDFTEKKVMKVYYEPLVRRIAANVFPAEISIGDKTFEFPQGTLSNPTESKALADATAKVS